MAFSNPFKKNQPLSDFKLDTEAIPNMSGNAQTGFGGIQEPQSASEPMNLPSLPEMSQSSSVDNFSNLGSDMNSRMQNNNFNSNSSLGQDLTPSFASSNPSSSSFGSDFSSSENSINNNSNYHANLNSAQMETALAKVTLLEAKMNAIEQKIDIITKILLEETSEETKRKIKVKDMMDTIRSS